MGPLEVGLSTPQESFPEGLCKEAEMLKAEKEERKVSVDCGIVAFASIDNLISYWTRQESDTLGKNLKFLSFLVRW